MGYVPITPGTGDNVATVTVTRDSVSQDIQVFTQENLLFAINDGSAHNGNAANLLVGFFNLANTAQTVTLNLWDHADQTSGQEYQIAELDATQVVWLPSIKLTSGFFSVQLSGAPIAPGVGVIYR